MSARPAIHVTFGWASPIRTQPRQNGRSGNISLSVDRSAQQRIFVQQWRARRWSASEAVDRFVTSFQDAKFNLLNLPPRASCISYRRTWLCRLSLQLGLRLTIGAFYIPSRPMSFRIWEPSQEQNRIFSLQCPVSGGTLGTAQAVVSFNPTAS
jgi:hypothetical protein